MAARRRAPVSSPAVPEDVRGRILRTAYELLFANGYSALTMDLLAHELGMSKKTIYAHFTSKDEVVTQIIAAIGQGVRQQTDAVLNDGGLSLPQKLQKVLLIVSENMGRAHPGLLRELQRLAPRVYQKIDELRATNIPLVIGRILRMGVAEGVVRADIDLDFATQFWIAAINGLSDPAALHRTGLSPRQTFDRAIRIFLNGVFTETGRRQLAAALETGEGPAPGAAPRRRSVGKSR